MAANIGISEATSLAMHSMVLIATRQGELLSAKEIASITGVSEAHLAKVLQRLSKANLLNSIRGPKGGFALTKLPAEITLLEIYETIEGELQQQGCPTNRSTCPFKACIFGGVLQKMTDQFYDYLQITTLAKLLMENSEKEESS